MLAHGRQRSGQAARHQYDIYLPYPFTHPDTEPVAIRDPQPECNAFGQAPPHVSRIALPGEAGTLYTLSVHDRDFDRQRWSSAVGFILALRWLIQYEDWLYGGRQFPSAVPQDIHARVDAMLAAAALTAAEASATACADAAARRSRPAFSAGQ